MKVEEVISRVAELCRQYDAQKVILYGSRAKGTALERSDIDIAVSGVKDFDTLSDEVEDLPTLYHSKQTNRKGLSALPQLTHLVNYKKI